MKRGLTLAVLTACVVSAQTPTPLRITGFIGSQLTWTNHLAANVPVYELLRATTVTGAWQHFLFVTNSTTVALTNSATAQSPAVFHKLSWASETPMRFSYEFEENSEFGPCVFGEISVSMIRDGTWSFEDDGFCFGGGHVTGSGTVRTRNVTWASTPHTAEFHLTSPPNSQYLHATLQSARVAGTLTYTGMVGTVYQNGFSGPTPLGTFRARRLP